MKRTSALPKKRSAAVASEPVDVKEPPKEVPKETPKEPRAKTKRAPRAKPNSEVKPESTEDNAKAVDVVPKEQAPKEQTPAKSSKRAPREPKEPKEPKEAAATPAPAKEVVKRPRDSSKRKTPPKETPAEAPKEADDAKKPKRKINMNSTLADKAGLNISVARVKNIVDVCILNKDEHTAAQEVRNAHHPPSLDADGKTEPPPPIPISALSAETQALIQRAKRFYDRAQKDEWDKAVLGKMTPEAKEQYLAARKAAKDAFEESMRTVPEFERGAFDVEEFNVRYDNNFYKDFVEAASTEDEWTTALGQLSKLRVRFSANSKILLSAFIELMLRQLAVNGTYNCIKSKKKIIKLSHALDFSPDDPHFSLGLLVTNTRAYRKYQASRSKEPEDEKEELADDAHDSDEKSDDDSRPNFRFYVSEICREVRMKLATKSMRVSDDKTEDTEVYNLTNVSRDFKDFCNELIFETVAILGRMILTEINTRGVKTLNDVIMKTVIEHLHSAYGVDFKTSLQFIEQVTTTYNVFVKQRRETRKSADEASDKKDQEHDVEYDEE